MANASELLDTRVPSEQRVEILTVHDLRVVRPDLEEEGTVHREKPPRHHGGLCRRALRVDVGLQDVEVGVGKHDAKREPPRERAPARRPGAARDQLHRVDVDPADVWYDDPRGVAVDSVDQRFEPASADLSVAVQEKDDRVNCLLGPADPGTDNPVVYIPPHEPHFPCGEFGLEPRDVPDETGRRGDGETGRRCKIAIASRMAYR